MKKLCHQWCMAVVRCLLLCFAFEKKGSPFFTKYLEACYLISHHWARKNHIENPFTDMLQMIWAIYYKSLAWFKGHIWGDSLTFHHHLGWPTGGKGRYKLPRNDDYDYCWPTSGIVDELQYFTNAFPWTKVSSLINVCVSESIYP